MANNIACNSMPTKLLLSVFIPRTKLSAAPKKLAVFAINFKKLTDHDIVLLGISKDNIMSHAKFINNYNVSFVMLSGPDTLVMQAYGDFGGNVMYGKKPLKQSAQHLS